MGGFFSWITENPTFVAALANFFAALLWIVYAQLGLAAYFESRKPRLFIEQANGHHLDSTIMLINLSKEPLHVASILVAINVGSTDGTEEEVRPVYDFVLVTQDSESDHQGESVLKQGPLQSGSYLILGETGRIFGGPRLEGLQDGEHSLQEQLKEAITDVENFELRVVTIYGTGDEAFGARRMFRIEPHDGDERIRPVDPQTVQMTSRNDRKIVAQWAEQARQFD